MSGVSRVSQIAEALRERGFKVMEDFRFHPYADARADLYAHKRGGPTLVVEVRELGKSVRVPVDEVQQVQQMARLLGRHRRVRAVGLLVTNGRVTQLADEYGARCDPRVYTADFGGIDAVLERIVEDSSTGDG